MELVRRAVENSGRPGDVVLDPFAGSGSTLIASEQTSRSASLVELDPRYVDVIARQWQSYTGGKPHSIGPAGALIMSRTTAR